MAKPFGNISQPGCSFTRCSSWELGRSRNTAVRAFKVATSTLFGDWRSGRSRYSSAPLKSTMAMVPSRFLSAAAARAAAAMRNTSSMVSCGLLRMVLFRSKKCGRIVGENFCADALIRHPIEHQIEQISVVRHRLEIIRMRPVRAPEQTIWVMFDQRVNERRHVGKRQHRLFREPRRQLDPAAPGVERLS